MTELQATIDNAWALLDASRHMLTSAGYAERKRNLYDASKPRVSRMKRERLIEIALRGLTEDH